MFAAIDHNQRNNSQRTFETSMALVNLFLSLRRLFNSFITYKLLNLALQRSIKGLLSNYNSKIDKIKALPIESKEELHRDISYLISQIKECEPIKKSVGKYLPELEIWEATLEVLSNEKLSAALDKNYTEDDFVEWQPNMSL